MQKVLKSPLYPDKQKVTFSILRVPFFLEPSYDENKKFMETNRQRLLNKWGGNEGWQRQKKNHDLKGRGIAAGIPHFNLDRLTGNTMASHRLIQHVGKSFGLSVSEALYDRLNVYYFVEGHSLNDRSRLAKVASEELLKHGHEVASDEILKFLNSNDGRQEIENAIHTLVQLGINGIPTFIIDGQTLNGAAGWKSHYRVFREIEDRGYVEKGPVFGKILNVSDDTIQEGSHVAAA